MTDLITLEEYKEFVSITNTTDDNKFASLIGSVSTLIKTYCARTFIDNYTVDIIESFNIDYATRLVQLTEFPIVSITRVEERSSYNAAYTELTTGDFEYYIDTSTDSLIRVSNSGYLNWPEGPGAVRVTYTGGFLDTPADLKLAVADLVTYYHKNEYRGSSSLRGASKNTPGTTSQWGNVSFPDHIKRVLDLYKNLQ